MTGISQADIIKNSVISGKVDSSYVAFCQVCGWYGYLQEKIICGLEGIRHEEEDGSVDIFTEYDYDIGTAEKGNLHIHKYNPKLVDEALEFALKMRNGGSCQE